MPQLQGYLTRTESSIRRWLMRKQSDYVTTSTLSRNRIYILPSRAGICLTALLTAMIMTALNYMSSLGMMFTFFIASMAFIAAFYTQRNLQGLTISSVPQDSFFVDEPGYFKIAVENKTGFARHGVLFRERNEKFNMYDIPAHSAVNVRMPVTSHRRGEFKLRRFDVATRMPVGLFNAWSWQTIKTSLWIYPQPIANHPAPVAPLGEHGDAAMSRESGEEFSSLKEYTPGDAIKHIAWKQQAKHGRLLTKEFNDEFAGEATIFEWDLINEENTELRLSYLCYWVLEAEKQQTTYGLKLPSQSIPLNKGEQHLERCLLALAQYPTA